MVHTSYSIVGLVTLFALAGSLLVLAFYRPVKEPINFPSAWKNYRFGFAIYALIFLAFDMEMIFMYPWAVVFAEIGMMAFLDMLVFIGLLSAGITYAWGMGGLKWE